MQQKMQDQLAAIQAQLKDIQGLLTAQSQAAVQKSKDLVAQMTPAQKQLTVVVTAALGLYMAARYASRFSTARAHRRRLADIEAQKQDGKLHLYIFPRSPFAPSASSPCAYTATFLRLAKIPHEVVETMDPFGSPTWCAPFIVYKGQVIADSKHIMEFVSKEFHLTMDNKLTRIDRATGTALEKMMEYSMNPVIYRISFIDHPHLGTHILRQITGLPSLLARYRVQKVNKWVEATYRYIPFGTLTREQYEQNFMRDCEAIEQQIGDKLFLFGDEPTSYDCAVYAVLIPFVNMKQYAEVSEAYMAVARSPILVEYLHRLTERAFPDVEELVTATNEARSEIAESLAGEEAPARA